MDAECRVMTFFNRVHEVDRHMMSLEFQHCNYCHEGWFGTRIKRQGLPGGFESEAYKKTNFLQAPQTQWLDPERPICENCLLEAKRRAAEGMPKEPLRFTSANYADPGETLPETDALTFFEEEILSPIQHIVRIFTLHATGQCELRGHVGNLFQNGPQYVRNIPAAIGDMKMLLIRRCPKDPNRKQRIPFLVSRRRLERALDRVCRPLSQGGSLALQAGALTPGGYVDLVKYENLAQFSDTEVGEEPEGLEVQVVEQTPWERVERKLFAMWMSCNLELQMAAEVRLLHERQEDAPRVSDTVGMSLRTAGPTANNPAGLPVCRCGLPTPTLIILLPVCRCGLPNPQLIILLQVCRCGLPNPHLIIILLSVCRCGLPNPQLIILLLVCRCGLDGMSLRTAEPTPNNNPAAGMSLRTAEPTANNPCLQEVERVEALWT